VSEVCLLFLPQYYIKVLLPPSFLTLTVNEICLLFLQQRFGRFLVPTLIATSASGT
jgi:hypothetical protein